MVPQPFQELDSRVHELVQGRTVRYIGFYVDHVLDGSHDLRLGVRFEEQPGRERYRGLLSLRGVRGELIELHRSWAEAKATALGSELKGLPEPGYRMPTPCPVRIIPLWMR